MNLTTFFVWECSPGEEIMLTIGGTYTPAGQHTEFDQPHGAHTELEWIEDAPGNRLAELNFTPDELEEMRQRLISEAEYRAAKNEQSRKLREMIGIPQRPHVI